MVSRAEKNRYLQFDLTEMNPKTMVYSVLSAASNELLGHIKWHNSWRKYVFFPLENTMFDSFCLSVIVDFIDYLMDERRDKNE